MTSDGSASADKASLQSMHAAMGPGAEFDTIRALISRWGALAADIGDDAAALHAPAGRTLVVSTDAFIENEHFREEWITPFEIGARATAAALSDLAAMGARAESILVAFTVPDAWRERLIAIADGIAATLTPTGGRIIGGNISRGATFGITTTAIGSATRVVRRSGARAGDRLLVTGRLGGPGQALRCWRDGTQPDAWSRERFAHPVPRLAEGEWFADAGVHAMLDISDGLVADSRHMAAASGVVLRLDSARIPRGEGISVVQALSSGEEYELLVACPPDVARALLDIANARGRARVSDIGEVLEARGANAPASASASAHASAHASADASTETGMIVIGEESRDVEFAPGHDHFSS
jgi:thiamine-monophosphate kinase